MKNRLVHIVCLLVFLSFLPGLSGTAQAVSLESGWKFYETDVISGRNLEDASTRVVLPYDAPEWQLCAASAKLPISPDARSVWITMKLPQVVSYQHPVLFFITTEEAVKVYIDHELIYSYGEFGLYHHTYGVKWHMVDLPSNYKGRQLSFQLYTDHPGRLGKLDNVSLNEGINQIQQIFNHDLLIWIALPMAIILLIIMLLYYQSMQQKRLYIYLAVFLALYAAWLTSALRTNLMIWDKPAFWWKLMLATAYTMPILGNLLIYEILPAVRRKMILGVIAGYVLLFLLMILGEAMGYNSMDRGITVYYIWLGISQVYAIGLLLFTLKKSRTVQQVFLLPALAFPIFGTLEGLSSHFRFFASPIYITPLGIFFLAFFIIWLLRENMREEQRLTQLTASLEKEMAAAAERAQIDSLTKCFNRGKLSEAMKKEINLAEYTGMPLALMMFDIDFFKSVNDTYGHDAGDRVLIDFTRIIRRQLDARHTFIRYGGEEFVVLCRGFSLEEAKKLALEIGASVQDAAILEKRKITCSIGISQWHAGSSDSARQLLKRSDLALYAAKQNGRNRVAAEDGSIRQTAGPEHDQG